MPNEIYNAIIEGLQKLVSLRLRGCPPEETIEGTVMVWIEALEYHCHWHVSDQERIQKSFARLFIECREWPTPAMFIERLPPRESIELPAPKISKEQQQANARFFEQLLNEVTSSTKRSNN